MPFSTRKFMPVKLPKNGLRREQNGFGFTSILYSSDLFHINLCIKKWHFLLL